MAEEGHDTVVDDGAVRVDGGVRVVDEWHWVPDAHYCFVPAKKLRNQEPQIGTFRSFSIAARFDVFF